MFWEGDRPDFPRPPQRDRVKELQSGSTLAVGLLEDLDFDGTVDFGDVVLLLAAWGRASRQGTLRPDWSRASLPVLRSASSCRVLPRSSGPREKELPA